MPRRRTRSRICWTASNTPRSFQRTVPFPIGPKPIERRSPYGQKMIRRDHARGPGVAGTERIPGGRKVISPSNQDL